MSITRCITTGPRESNRRTTSAPLELDSSGLKRPFLVIPAKAGNPLPAQAGIHYATAQWIPAFAGKGKNVSILVSDSEFPAAASAL